MDPPLRLETPEQARDSEARDQALTVRAKRRQEEVAVERARFELTRDKIVFSFSLMLAVVAAVVTVAVHPESIPIALLGGGGLGGLAAVALRRSPKS